MNIEDKISGIINESEYANFLKDRNHKETYLYHFILVKYKDHNDICSIKIDSKDDIKKIVDKNILYKYYIEKIHYYNEFNNIQYDKGMPIHIYNLGFFEMNGDLPLSKEEKNQISDLFSEYEKNYNSIYFDFDDETFLSLNK